MPAPRETTDIRTDVSANIAQNYAIGVTKALSEAMWWNEETHLASAQEYAEMAVSHIKAARANFAARAKA